MLYKLTIIYNKVLAVKQQLKERYRHSQQGMESDC